MSNKKKRADNVGSARSSRSRLGQIEQDKMTAKLSQLTGKLSEVLGSEFIKVEVEPILKEINKKKLN
jgi:hypothetical protein|tara:strand:- start:233 stop:433 length:201 start_codon:yes stop_codon:yes gene_type:complete